MNKSRKAAELRREEILTAAVKIATEHGLPAVSGSAIAKLLGVSRPAVAYHITSMHVLRDSVMQRAIKLEILPILVHGLSANNPIALAAPSKLKRRAAESLL